MRNIRLYGTEAEFIAHEQSAGGDGLTTESIYPGVSMAKDIRKRYFNPHHEVVLIHTLTINYVDPYGVPVSESETKRFKYIPGVTQEVVITPKNVSGYVTTNELPVVVTIPNDSVVNIKYISEEYEQMKEIPLTLEITSGGYLRWKTSNSNYSKGINFRQNGGSWIYGYSSTSTGGYLTYVNPGDVIEFMGDNASYGSGSDTYGSFSGSTCRFNVKGNIMSLIGSSGYSAVTELASAATFVGLFGQTQVVDASMLYMPATTALSNCYYAMFSGCTALTKTPILPAKMVGVSAYSYMFAYCKSLTTAPELPATTLAKYCCQYMFEYCTSLTTAPSSIGTSATTMENYCCQYMFYNCTSLTAAPELPATTLVNYCYTYMFVGCTNLNYIKCLATTNITTSTTYNWVYGVAPSGTFIKDPNASWVINSNNGIPSGWTVINAEGVALNKKTEILYQDADTVEIEIMAFTNWTASTSDSWITLGKSTGTASDTSFTFSVSSTEEPRTGSITFSWDGGEVTLSIIQDNAYATPLTFNIISAGTLYWKCSTTSGSHIKIIEYKKNGGDWISITSSGSSYAPAISVNVGDVVQFRGDNITYAGGTTYIPAYYNFFSASTNTRFSASGNILSLVSYSAELTNEYTFCCLFSCCSGLTDASGILLPSIALTNYCYYGMFSGCTSLTTAPILPATTLAQYCYSYMFQGCTNLTTAPTLPATTLANNCYSYMFRGCTSLTTAPELPAATLAWYCYQYMFSGCTNLNYIKCLATNISATDCTTNWVIGVASSGTFLKYPSMTSWTIGVDGIPTNWDAYGYGFWISEEKISFSEVTSARTISISSLSNWSATTNDTWYTLSQYEGEIGLTEIVITADTANLNREGAVIFTDGVSSLTLTIVERYLNETPLTFEIISDGDIIWKSSTSSYTRTIEYKKNNGEWTSITSNTGSSAPTISVASGDTIQLRGNNTNYGLNYWGYYNTFSGTTCKFNIYGNLMSLVSSSGFSGETKLGTDAFYFVFYGCTGLTNAEELLLTANTLTDDCYCYMFQNCYNLKTAPNSIGTFTTKMALSACSNMFANCTSLTKAPALPATTLTGSCYERMFQGCTSLTTAPALPATTLANRCYHAMFSGCTSLTTAPELLAEKLVSSCYTQMFFNCTNLNYIKCLATDISASNCTSNWVYNVASAGTFVKHPSVTTWTTGMSGIPSGWVAEDYKTVWFSKDNIVLPESASSEQIIVYANTEWSAITHNDWITLSQTSGVSGETILTISVSSAPNKRDGIINFITENCEEKVIITQNTILYKPLTFIIESDGVIKWTKSGDYYAQLMTPLTLEYKKNNEEWVSITNAPGSSAPSFSVVSGDTIQFRGNNHQYFDAYYSTKNYFITTCDFSVEGNIMSIVDATNFQTIKESGCMLGYLFNGCNVTDASKLGLPIIKILKSYVYPGTYTGLFSGCQKLRAAPELPATTLIENCYQYMFHGCTSLTTAPALPATTLGSYCYYFMFQGCTSLTAAPELPATTLASSCYTGMFAACRSLTTAPELPATTLASSCYTGMFSGCTSLTTAPELPATTLAPSCYENMFYGCTSLTTAPELPATTLANRCYLNMFLGCTSLTTAPELPATTLATTCYSSMFLGCTSLTTAPELPATTLASSCYSSMFSGCTGLTTAPALPATTLADYCYYAMFSGCSSLNRIECLATTNVTTANTQNWVNGVSASGIFTKADDFSGWTIGINGIPENWTIYNESDVIIEIGGTYITCPFSGSTFQIPLNYINGKKSGGWSASTEDSWISLDKATGTSADTGVTVTVSSTSTRRTGYITFETKDMSLQYSVDQINKQEEPLTIVALGNGTLFWKASDSNNTKTITYRVNDGEWTNVTSTTNGEEIGTPGESGGTGTYVVSGLGTTYGFALNENDYYESNNKGVNSSAADCRVVLNLTGNCKITFKYINYAESNYDYGIFGKIDAVLGTGNSWNSANVYKNCQGTSSSSEQMLTYTAGTGEHFIDIKYSKDSSSHAGNDSLQFKVEISENLQRTVSAGDRIQIKADNNSYGNSYYYNYFSGAPKFNIVGNIMSLVDSTGYSANTTLSSSYTFNYLFNRLDIQSAEYLLLAATTLTEYCYQNMFAGCKNLTAIPELPATTLAGYCYYGMFSGCTSLTTAPALPVTALTSYCYAYMFSNCTSLTTAPVLPATTLAQMCYYYMFSNCTSLTTAPALPATALAGYCYEGMFRGCTSLTTAPELPATTLVIDCYRYMFQGCTGLITPPSSIGTSATTVAPGSACSYMFYNCTSLTTAPKLPATTLEQDCYSNMFYGCTSLTEAPELPATTLAWNCYPQMFAYCTSLTKAPTCIGNSATTAESYACSSMFAYCTSLTTAPELPATTLTGSCYAYMFKGCTNLTTPPSSIGTSATTMGTWSKSACLEMFSGCTSLTTAPALPATVLADGCYAYMFGGCTSLTAAPELPATTLASSCYTGMFSGCTNLTTAPTSIGNSATTMTTSACTYMFYNCTNLTTAPILPATTLAQYCYSYMFRGCTSLTTAPELPATTLASSCYSSMFRDCTSLTTAPSILPATTLASYCYQDMFRGCTGLTTAPSSIGNSATTMATSTCNYMFYGCTSLTAAPELPATTLANYCYSNMFSNCTSLTIAPELPATTLANSCYEYMFQSCTSLTTAPALPASSLTNNCYSLMFNRCTSLTVAPELPATTLATECYNRMFERCTSLISAPELPATTLANYCYCGMFRECTNLTTAPELPATTLANNCYTEMFYSCTTLTIAPSSIGTSATTMTNSACTYMFTWCSSLTTAPALPATTLASSCYKFMFDGCTSLTTAPELPATTLAESCYYDMFGSCINLTSAPSTLPATILASSCYTYMFTNCTSLTTAPELPAVTLAVGCYAYMFKGCTGLTATPSSIGTSATTMTNSACYYMFSGCTSLTTAPELPATTLASSCYQSMFNGCTRLNYIKCLATNISASSCLYNWTYNVSSTGTFVKDPNMSSWTTGTSGIPTNWTVEDATL